jgi:hypothetical protein
MLCRFGEQVELPSNRPAAVSRKPPHPAERPGCGGGETLSKSYGYYGCKRLIVAARDSLEASSFG